MIAQEYGGKEDRRTVWSIIRLNPVSFEQKSGPTWVLALTVTECLHEFSQLGASFLETGLVVSIGDFDVEVFATSRIAGGSRRRQRG